MKKYVMQLSYSQCASAKRITCYQLKQSASEQYGKLWDYDAELSRSNPGSTIKLGVANMLDGSAVFKRMYICFKESSEGWKQGTGVYKNNRV